VVCTWMDSDVESGCQWQWLERQKSVPLWPLHCKAWQGSSAKGLGLESHQDFKKEISDQILDLGKCMVRLRVRATLCIIDKNWEKSNVYKHWIIKHIYCIYKLCFFTQYSKEKSHTNATCKQIDDFHRHTIKMK
jgi:hypothetical protein